MRATEPLAVKNFNWASCVGISIAGVESAVLLAYHTGWKLSLVSLIDNTGSAVLLVVIGSIFFRERLSGRSVIGIVLCMVGLVLISRQ